MKKLSLGIDIGTSKICVAVFEMDTQKIKCLTFNNNVIFPTMIAIPRVNTGILMVFPEILERPTEKDYIVIDSTKRCVICEWSYQIRREKITEQDCVNPRNYKSKDWCKEGQRQFVLGQFEWKPQDLFIQLLMRSIERIESALHEEYVDKEYAISEIKVGVPMIFHQGEFYVNWLANKVNDIITTCIGHKLEKNALIDIVHEPIATLMAHSYEQPNVLPHGYFLVVDSGAGTTDIVLCQRKGDKISFIDFDSWNIAGDNYDVAMEEIIREIIDVQKINVPPELQIAKKYAKEFKEYYYRTKSAPSLSLTGIPPIVVPPEKIESHFSKVNNYIVERIKTFVDKHRQKNIEIRKLYLTGGCINVESLPTEIQKSIGISSDDILKIEIKEPDINKYDPMMIGVSVGCAIPKSKYLKVMVYTLPIDIVIEEVVTSQNIQERFKKLGTLYKANTEKISDQIRLEKINPEANLVFRVITQTGDQRELKRINVGRYYKERKKRRPLVIKLKYFVDYNGKLTITAFSNHVPEEKEVYSDFVLF